MRMPYTPSLNHTFSLRHRTHTYSLLHKKLQTLYPDVAVDYPRLPANLTLEEIFLWELVCLLKEDLDLERYLPALLPFPQRTSFNWERVGHILQSNSSLFFYLKDQAPRLKALTHVFGDAQISLPS